MPGTSPRLDETRLFSDAGGSCQVLSPRAAFQAAIHGRASILDLRTGAERSREGELPAYLSRGGADGHREVIALVGDDGLTLGLPAIVGGFGAWRAAGMPVAQEAVQSPSSGAAEPPYDPDSSTDGPKVDGRTVT